MDPLARAMTSWVEGNEPGKASGSILGESSCSNMADRTFDWGAMILE